MAAGSVGAAAGGDRDSCWWSQGRNRGGKNLGSGGRGHSRIGRTVGCPTDPAVGSSGMGRGKGGAGQ
jgi:hypothetical protein